jgi:hypothetical protein
MKRLVLTLILAATALIGTSAVAPAGIVGAYPPGQSGVIRVNVSSVRLNETFTVTFEPCAEGETVIFRFRNQTETTTCSGGSASATFTPRVPPGQAGRLESLLHAEVPGPGVYEVCGDAAGSSLCTEIEVLAAAPGDTNPTTTAPGDTTPATTVSPGAGVPSTTPGAGLPATGSSGIGTTATSALVLLIAGALLLIVTQVRRHRTAA